METRFWQSFILRWEDQTIREINQMHISTNRWLPDNRGVPTWSQIFCILQLSQLLRFQFIVETLDWSSPRLYWDSEIVTNVCIVKYYEILVTTIIYSLLLQIRTIYNNLNMSKYFHYMKVTYIVTKIIAACLNIYIWSRWSCTKGESFLRNIKRSF